MSDFWKPTPVIALAAAVALLVAGVIIAVYNERAYRAQEISEIGVQAEILASSVTAALVFNDAAAAQEYVNALKANREVQAAGVYDVKGMLVASYARSGGSQVPPTAAVRQAYFEDDRLVVVTPVTQGGSTLGTVYMRTATEPWTRRLARYSGIGFLIVMASLVVVVLGAAHAALSRANAQLQDRALALAEANRQLHAQIEAREQTEEALRQSQKMEAIGQLSGGIAHDFNNLLTVIRGNLQLLQKRIAEGRGDVGQYIDLAMDGLNRASSVTQRVLAFSRRQPLSPKPVALSRLVEEMDTLLRHSVGQAISVETRLEADWWTLCDPNQMENVVLNLVINARDAMPEGGRLTIETANVPAADAAAFAGGAAPGDYVRLTVTDSGVGMSGEVRDKAIEPFFTTKPLGQGTGLGLSMIFGYVKQSEGHLAIESEEGQGTSITILMPRHEGLPAVETAAEPAAALPPEPAEKPAAPAKAPTILLVEDEIFVRMIAVETLRDEGFEVLEEGDGQAALEVLESGAAIDLLITDVKLPGLSGYRLAEAGAARRPGLKVLLMTGYAQEPVPEALAAAGVQVLYKPYDVSELAARANQMLNHAAA